MDHPAQELAASERMSGSYYKFILQFELLDHRNESVIYSWLARDVSGPSKTPFLTMLMLEGTIACVQTPMSFVKARRR